MKRRHQQKCCHCKEFYLPDPRSRYHQRYCSQPACRKASKAGSQRRWLSKPENQNYFRGEDNTRRVQQWRQSHPGYWRKRKTQSPEALQDDCQAQVAVQEEIAIPSPLAALQEVSLAQPAVLVGLIATMTGSALQEDILAATRGFIRKGQDILGLGLPMPATSWQPQPFGEHEDKISALHGTAAAGAAPV